MCTNDTRHFLPLWWLLNFRTVPEALYTPFTNSRRFSIAVLEVNSDNIKSLTSNHCPILDHWCMITISKLRASLALKDRSEEEAWGQGVCRDIILQLRKKGLTDQSLSFQANIFELLPPTNLQFCAFGRNLSDAYVKSNQIYEAIRVREQVLTTLPISSTIRTSWIMALDGLYKKVDKDDYLKTLSDSMFVENE